MIKKVADYLVTVLTVASAGLLIAMMYQDIAQFDSKGIGYFVLNTDEVTYCWPNGQRALTESIWWLKPGLITAAVLLFIPIVLSIFRKKTLIFIWVNVLVMLSVILVENWGIGHGTEQIESLGYLVNEVKYEPAFYFPYYGFGFSVLAALLFSFYRNWNTKRELK